MLKFIATDVVISKGFNDNPALRFSEDGNSVRFRIGKRTYDKREKDNYRWLNLGVKAFGTLCERIKKMQLDVGTYIHIEGRYDEDTWESDGKTMRTPVIILTDIEKSYSGTGKQDGAGDVAQATETARSSVPNQQLQQENSTEGEQVGMPENFTGFESFGGPNPFYPQG